MMMRKPLLRLITVAAILFAMFGFKASKPGMDKIIISGSVKDQDGNPLEKAKVLFDTTVMALTDKDGKFSFELTLITPAAHNIYFTDDSFTTAVRTYYPVMLSSNYDVMLRKVLTKRQINIGGPVPTTIDTVKAVTKTKEPVPAENVVLDLPSIIFKINMTGLNSENKAFLDIISGMLSKNPAVKIDIKAYTPEHDENPVIAQKRLANIVKYLVEKGISARRLKKVTIAGGGEENTIDLVNSTEQ
jgi:hypothetical protein